MVRVLPFLLAAILLASCTKNVTRRVEVYFNDFENRSLQGIQLSNPQGLQDADKISNFAGNKVYGPLNNGAYVELTIKELPIHNRLKIEFDLYIHDNWTGNLMLPGMTQPDLWVLGVDQSYPIFTTFSNVPGQFQTYPDNYVPGYNPFPAKGNAWKINLPGACASTVQGKGTTMYKVDLFQNHSDSLVRVAFTDQMPKPHPLCEKSWSVDNVRVTAMNFH